MKLRKKLILSWNLNSKLVKITLPMHFSREKRTTQKENSFLSVFFSFFLSLSFDFVSVAFKATVCYDRRKNKTFEKMELFYNILVGKEFENR